MKILNLLFFEDQKKALDLYTRIFDKLGEAVLPLIHYSFVNWERCINPNGLVKLHHKNDRFMEEQNYML